MSRLPLPPALTANLEAFFAAKATGTFIVQVREGRVTTYEIHYKGAVREEPRRT
jgi:hypothetical protein